MTIADTANKKAPVLLVQKSHTAVIIFLMSVLLCLNSFILPVPLYQLLDIRYKEIYKKICRDFLNQFIYADIREQEILKLLENFRDEFDNENKNMQDADFNRFKTKNFRNLAYS